MNLLAWITFGVTLAMCMGRLYNLRCRALVSVVIVRPVVAQSFLFLHIMRFVADFTRMMSFWFEVVNLGSNVWMMCMDLSMPMLQVCR